MKRILGIFFLLITLGTYSQTKTILKEPKVVKHVELLHIVLRLGDSREYNSKRFPKYADYIEKHFTRYKKHKFIKYIKK